MIEFKDNEELGKYVEEHKIIKESIKCDFNISLNTDLIVKGNITAWNINANDINAWNINARDINADDIDAGDIKACDIDAWNINAGDIKTCDINAGDISYNAVCFAYNNIECKSITGRRENHKHFVLDGKIIFKEKEVVKDYFY